MSRIVEPGGKGVPYFSLVAWIALVAGPLIGHLGVQLVVSPNCGMWGLNCLFYTGMVSLAFWTLGTISATIATVSDEPRGLAIPALLLNALPLLGALVATGMFIARN